MAQRVYRIGSQIVRVAGGGGPWREPGQPFDFYISTTGTGTASGGGTLIDPWPISMISNSTAQSRYAGKRVGLLPGTYDISSLMKSDAQDATRNPALNINGGTSNLARTFIGSSDANGFYSPRTATIDAKGSSGFFGGGNDKTNAPIGCNSTVTNKGFWTLDGIKLIGFSMWGIHIGDSPSGGTPVTDWTIQNCEITGGDATNNTVSNGVNLGPLIVYSGRNGLVTNNYFHDNTGWYQADTIHFSCVYQWGIGNAPTRDNKYTFNTIINSSNLQGKEDQQYNTEIAYNYIDMTGTAGTSNVTACPIFGFMGDLGAGTLTSIHHNVLLHRGAGISIENTNNAATYVRTPCAIYNNTLVCVGLQASDKLLGGYVNTGQSGVIQQVSAYNNMFYDNGFSVSAYGYVLSAIDLFALYSYNQHGGWAKWNTVPDSASGSTPLTTYSTLASFVAAVGGTNNPAVNSGNPFTSGGNYAKAYQVQSGSFLYQAGRVGGTPGGSVCNIGAWDGTVTQIGADWVN